MAITLPGANDNDYYTGTSLGQYQFLTLEEIIESFLATYVGVGKICENVRANDVYFHATRALQEFSYDTFRSIKAQEIVLGNNLQMILPRDFVNQVQVSFVDGSGIKNTIYPARETSNPTDVTQDESTDNNTYTFTNNVLDSDEQSETFERYKGTSSSIVQTKTDYVKDNSEYSMDERYGLDPQYAQINGSYYIDYRNGKIHFSSDLSGKTIVLDYISDGMSVDDSGGIPSGSAIVHKFAEEAMYKHIAYGCLSAMKDTPAGLLSMLKKERFAETRKAKLRLSNIKLKEIVQVMRSGYKWIKRS